MVYLKFLEEGLLCLPTDVAVYYSEEHHQDRDSVEEAVSDQRPPVQRDDGSDAKAAYGDDEHDVEHCRPDHSGDTLKLRSERQEFWSQHPNLEGLKTSVYSQEFIGS